MLTLHDLWDQKGFIPNKEQEQAILQIDGPLFLTAGPGSGKTRVLLWRTVNLIVFHGIAPEDIFLGTFTEKAAKQLKDGLMELLGLATNENGKPYDISGMAIGTIHSICRDLLSDRRFTEGERGVAPIIMDELSQYFMLYNGRFWNELCLSGGFESAEEAQEMITEYFAGRPSKSRHEAVIKVISFFNRLSEEDANEDKIDPKDDVVITRLLSMYTHYKKILTNGNGRLQKTDFSMLQQFAYRLIKGNSNAGSIFKYLIIDEYQDTNKIQEKIYFSLAQGHKNICVVGDDDQALYRFRGASVENFVEFENRSIENIGLKPTRINLSTNYRSRKEIVDFYTGFMEQYDWKRESCEGHYRVMNKGILAHSEDNNPAVLTTQRDKGEVVYAEIASFVKNLKAEGKIQDYSQVAFLFPSVKGRDGMGSRVRGYKEALEELGIPVYAPRANRFLELEEAKAIFGLIQLILPPAEPEDKPRSFGMRGYEGWLDDTRHYAKELCAQDKQLARYVQDRIDEVKRTIKDYDLMRQLATKLGLELHSSFDEGLLSKFRELSGLSEQAKRNLSNTYFIQTIRRKIQDGDNLSVFYILNRTASIDWNVLDLFYQFGAFAYFKSKYDLAEASTDEGPVCNLGLITQYLSRFLEDHGSVITGSTLTDNRFGNTFFRSYCYALYRLQEGEYEDNEDPFPKGRIPFLTIHQSKGLEFPVVVMGSVYKEDREAPIIETVMRQYVRQSQEPLERMSELDNARMFYVGLSRAQNLLIIPRYTHGKAMSEPFKRMVDLKSWVTTDTCDFNALPVADGDAEKLGGTYSYTSDYLAYLRCPRNYMIYKKYGFTASRGSTMLFGSLIHETIEDLHHYLKTIPSSVKGDA